jgi:hypothetical protein
MSPRLNASLSNHLFWAGLYSLTLSLSYAVTSVGNLVLPHLLSWMKLSSAPPEVALAEVATALLYFFAYVFALARFAIGEYRYFTECYPRLGPAGDPWPRYDRKLYVELVGLSIRGLFFWLLAFTLTIPEGFLCTYAALMLVDSPFLLYGVVSHTETREVREGGVVLTRSVQPRIVHAASRWLCINLFTFALLLLFLHAWAAGLVPQGALVVSGLAACLANSIADVRLTAWVYQAPIPWRA